MFDASDGENGGIHDSGQEQVGAVKALYRNIMFAEDVLIGIIVQSTGGKVGGGSIFILFTSCYGIK